MRLGVEAAVAGLDPVEVVAETNPLLQHFYAELIEGVDSRRADLREDQAVRIARAVSRLFKRK